MPFGPATTGRTRFDIGDLVRRHRAKLEAEVPLTLAQRRVLSAIALCRTAALGGHVELCRPCGYEHPVYNSCGNRHCPKCQALAQERWIGARSERLVPTRHFHVVFTLPSELRALAKRRPAPLFNALFRSAAASLLELGQSRLGATLGITMVLHTWTRELLLHPHVHAIVTAGGLSLDRSRWVRSNPKYLFPVKALGALLRGKMITALRRLHLKGRLEDPNPLADPESFDRLIAALARRSWVVYAKKPFRETEHVLAYLGRYTHRVGIANSRLVDVTDDAVTFRTKQGKCITLAPVEFLRRLLLHVLPDGLQKIRHYGLYAGSHAGALLPIAHRLATPLPSQSTAPSTAPTPPLSSAQLLQALTGRDVLHCPRCGRLLERIPVHPTARAPPARIAA